MGRVRRCLWLLIREYIRPIHSSYADKEVFVFFWLSPFFVVFTEQQQHISLSNNNMSSLANNQRTKTTSIKGNGNDVIVLRALKESLNSIILRAVTVAQQRSSGAQKIMDRLASVWSDGITTGACYHHHQRRLPATKQTSDEKDKEVDKQKDAHNVKNTDDHDHHPPRLIQSSSLDTSSYSFASSSTLDTLFANSLDNLFRLPSQSHRGLNNMTSSSCINTEHHRPHKQKKKWK